MTKNGKNNVCYVVIRTILDESGRVVLEAGNLDIVKIFTEQQFILVEKDNLSSLKILDA